MTTNFLLAASGHNFPLWTAAPFAALLFTIAFLPLLAPHFWHSNRNKAFIGASFGAPVALYSLFLDPTALLHTGLEYAAFVALLGALFTIAGGIRVTGALAGTPLSNTALLAAGAALANVVGTTGAAMLLIRPLLRANRRRHGKTHLVIFFIIIVANCGGCLTPLGDPPLFLGFLQGVPFAWTLGLWPIWATVVGSLLFVFNLYDQYRFNREELREEGELMERVQPLHPLGIEGRWNILLLLAVVAAVLLGGFLVHPLWGGEAAQIAQSAAFAGLAWVSWKITPRRLREDNDFSWHPFVEVMVLFAGIFAAMIPALAVLRTHGPALALSRPWQFFWMTGCLSAFLDNAPTYLAFLSMAQFLPDQVAGTSHEVLRGISCGAVFFGALTYIGNGPNFMVRAIAEHSGVRMPSFPAYLLWATVILSPILLAVSLIFL